MTVIVRGGVYRLSETLILTPADSYVSYISYHGEHPVISGGQVVTGWKQTSSKVWTAPFSGSAHQLFIAANRTQRARLPVDGFYRADGPSSNTELFKFRGTDVHQEWAGRRAEIVALYFWSTTRLPILAVDPITHAAKVPASPNLSMPEADARYWIENVPNGPQAAGQWYDDYARNLLLYEPKDTENLAEEEVVVPHLPSLIILRGGLRPGSVVSNICFKGLDFRHTDWTLPQDGFVDVQDAVAVGAAIETSHATGILFDHCTFTQMGGYAISFGRGAKHNRLLSSEIFDMGAGGVKIGETGLQPNEEDQNEGNFVTDNEIHDLGSVYPSAAGIWIGQSANNTIAHNDVHDLFYTAISLGFTYGYGPSMCSGNKVEFNHLHDIGKEVLSDMGGIYTLGFQPSTVIRNNLIHDITAFAYGGWGIYLDEGSSGLQIENNIVYRTSSSSIHQHYGRDNVIRNNIFALGKEYQIMRTRGEPADSFELQENIIFYSAGQLFWRLWSGGQVNADKNIYWDTRGQETFTSQQWASWQKSGHDVHSVIADPQFQNPGAYDFRLREGSPALALGFHQILTADIGPRGVAGARAFQDAE